MSQHIVRGVAFDESGGIVLEYLTPAEDVRVNGLVINHALLVPAEPEFENLLEDLEEAVQRALSAALLSHREALALQLPDDDDEAGPYDNPSER